MSDKIMREDEEYKYPEEEYVAGSQATTESVEEEVVQQPMPAWKVFVMRNKRLLGVAALAVIAIIAFQVMQYEKNNKVIQDKPTQTVEKKQPQVNQQTPVLQELGMLQRVELSNSQSISKVQSQLQGMQSQLDQTNETNQQLKQAMTLLLQELKRVNNYLNEQPTNVSKKPSGPPQPVVTYHIRALVDDRAWIVGSDGLTESVTTGDPIPHYGLVKKIDSAAGVIVTTSGKVIKLGHDDY